VAAVKKQIAQANAAAEKLAARLDAIVRAPSYRSPRVATEAIAREGSLYDGLRTSVQRAEVTGPEAASWPRAQEAAAYDKLVLRRYLEAIALAKKVHLRTPPLTKAWERLRAIDAELGPDAMREATAGIEGFSYAPGMFAGDLAPE
jgi:hypothetical protein